MKKLIQYFVCICALSAVFVACATGGSTADEHDSVVPVDLSDGAFSCVSSVILGVDAAYTKLGCPTVLTDGKNELHTFTEILDCACDRYTDVVFDYSSVERTEYGFTVEIEYPLDPYGNRIVLWFERSTGQGNYLIVSAASSGPDGIMQFDGHSSLRSKNEFDDHYLYVTIYDKELTDV